MAFGTTARGSGGDHHFVGGELFAAVDAQRVLPVCGSGRTECDGRTP